MSRTYGFLSTYPPTQCGIATFSRSLMRGLTTTGTGDRASVVRVVDAPITHDAPEVIAYLHTRAVNRHQTAAQGLNTCDVAIIQHEFGIYGGLDGEQVLAVLDEVTVPTVVVAHTVLADPTAHQRQVLTRVIDASGAVVTMTRAAHDRLIAGYEVDPAKVSVIPHGAPPLGTSHVPGPPRRPLILTWGLLGPGKGIEWAVDALAQLRHLRPRPTYVVAGQTHPRVRAQQGEAYRLQLGQRARAVGVFDLVRFHGSYLDEATLSSLIDRADVILLPYDSREQVTSGVLVEAVAAGKPIVATAFPHAVELLSGGAGLLVPQFDAAAMSAALQRVLTEPDLVATMNAAAARVAPSLTWTAVADEYRNLTSRLLDSRAAAIG